MRAQQPVGLVTGEPFQGPQPSPGNNFRGDQKMDMIRHHHKRMQFISVKFVIPIA